MRSFVRSIQSLHCPVSKGRAEDGCESFKSRPVNGDTTTTSPTPTNNSNNNNHKNKNKNEYGD